jgi:uncharacterized protein YdeI (YjbR/CyaY-like superfamily)
VAEPGTTPSEPRFFERPEQLRDWLDANHDTAAEVFVGAWKKSTGKPSLTWEQIVDEALCVGWIDGIRRGLPGAGWSIRLTPRRKGSNWSAVNVANVERLRAEGRMRPAGEAAFALRTEDRTGVYSYEQRHAARLSPAQEAELRANPVAWAWLEGQTPAARAMVVWWVASAKRPETQAKRLATLIADAAAGRKPPPLQSLAEVQARRRGDRSG